MECWSDRDLEYLSALVMEELPNTSPLHHSVIEYSNTLPPMTFRIKWCIKEKYNVSVAVPLCANCHPPGVAGRRRALTH